VFISNHKNWRARRTLYPRACYPSRHGHKDPLRISGPTAVTGIEPAPIDTINLHLFRWRAHYESGFTTGADGLQAEKKKSEKKIDGGICGLVICAPMKRETKTIRICKKLHRRIKRHVKPRGLKLEAWSEQKLSDALLEPSTDNMPIK
jgi:hypothetical protein